MLVMEHYLNFVRFKFYYKIYHSNYNSDTCKHSLFTCIGIIIFKIVIPNYFYVLVSLEKITL